MKLLNYVETHIVGFTVIATVCGVLGTLAFFALYPGA
ncbi:hypothetical protein EDB31_13544 [Vibrio crassostreae]|nr:hypothetical protein EDB31_13544 [Vibrio crassostreae]